MLPCANGTVTAATTPVQRRMHRHKQLHVLRPKHAVRALPEREQYPVLPFWRPQNHQVITNTTAIKTINTTAVTSFSALRWRVHQHERVQLQGSHYQDRPVLRCQPYQVLPTPGLESVQDEPAITNPAATTPVQRRMHQHEHLRLQWRGHTEQQVPRCRQRAMLPTPRHQGVQNPPTLTPVTHAAASELRR